MTHLVPKPWKVSALISLWTSKVGFNWFYWSEGRGGGRRCSLNPILLLKVRMRMRNFAATANRSTICTRTSRRSRKLWVVVPAVSRICATCFASWRAIRTRASFFHPTRRRLSLVRHPRKWSPSWTTTSTKSLPRTCSILAQKWRCLLLTSGPSLWCAENGANFAMPTGNKSSMCILNPITWESRGTSSNLFHFNRFCHISRGGNSLSTFWLRSLIRSGY